MPASIGHACVAVLVNPVLARPDRRASVVWAAAACAAAPDLDAVGVLFGGPFEVSWLAGHRGITHSLAVAVIAGVAAAVACRRRWHLQSLTRCLAYFSIVIASHGLLDCLTTYGLGVRLLAPFSLVRFSAPIHPISEASEAVLLWLPAFVFIRGGVGGIHRGPLGRFADVQCQFDRAG